MPTPDVPANHHAPASDGRHDFDFLHGRWRVAHRRLQRRLAGCTRWDAFDAFSTCRPLLGGLANLETHDTGPEGRAFGLALRLYAPATGRWAIHWANGDDGVLEPPVQGGFDGEVGLFHGEDVHDGRPVRVRFAWTRLDADHARWEQAFSADGGTAWETNWVMAFARVHGPVLPLPPGGAR